MLAAAVFASGFVVQPVAYRTFGSACSAKMAVERKPGEGDPFAGYGVLDNNPAEESISFIGRNADNGYIENDDEPWHSTCKPMTAAPTKGVLASSFEATVPYFAAEEALTIAMTTVATPADVDAAIKACVADGGRPGCPAIMAAEKAKKDAKDGKVKAAVLKKVAQGAGWDNFSRTVAKVHDNSV